jgi:hypothetical protein
MKLIAPPPLPSKVSSAFSPRRPTRREILGGALGFGVGLGCAGKAPPLAKPATPPPAPAAPPAAVEIAPVFYTLVVEARDLGADILLNDVLVESVDPADRATLSSGINVWVQPGENRLDIKSRAGHGRGPEHGLRVRVGRQRADAPGRKDLLADLNVQLPQPDAAFAEAGVFRADPAPPAELWAKARPLTLDAATRTEAARLVRALERALYRRNVVETAALLEWKTLDTARAGFQDPALARAAQQESLEALFADPGYIVDHFTPELLEFELAGGGRLVRINRPGGPAVQVRLSQGGRYRLPVLAANIGGTFRIVR